MNQVRYTTLDLHTAGEPVRIITGGYPELQGKTILEKRRDARARFDHIRRALMLEPRGHAGMYGVIPTAPCAAADLAVLFTHNEGYSTMCGHATIAIGRWAVDYGLVDAHGGRARFRLETPCGVVPVTVDLTAPGSPSVSFENVPSFASHLGARLDVPGFGAVTFDIAYGGAYYAILPSSALGLPFAASSLDTLVDAGVRVTDVVRAALKIEHPDKPDLGFLYGTILTDDTDPARDDATSNLCIFAQGQIDRSPTGSGVSARMALDYAKGAIAPGRRRTFRGVSGQCFEVELVEAEGAGLSARATVRVAGQAWYTAESSFIVEPSDPFGDGFVLADSFARLVP